MSARPFWSQRTTRRGFPETLGIVTASTSALVVRWRELPFHSTVEDEMKFDPETVKVKAGSPAVPLFGVKEMSDGAGFGGMEELPPEPPPQPVMKTRTNRVARAALVLM